MKKHSLLVLSACLAAGILIGCGRSPAGSASPAESASAASQGAASSAPSETAAPSGGADAASAVQDSGELPSYYGTWEVKDYQSAEVSALSDDEMEAFRGAVLTYQADAVLLNGEAVSSGELSYQTSPSPYDYDSLSEAYKANLGEWWNGIDTVSRVTAGPGEGFFGDCFFTVDGDTLWIYYEGVFFLAKQSVQ